MLRFKKKIKIADVGITAVAGILSVCMMCYAVYKFGLQEAWPELILNMFYVTCLTMIGLYFFNRMSPNQFNYRCSMCVGMTILFTTSTSRPMQPRESQLIWQNSKL